MERWLVISNCQTVGLANCLQAQTSEIAVTGLDTGRFNAGRWRMNARMREYDRLLIYPAIMPEIPKARLDRIGTHVSLPIVTFHAYHPDLIYFFYRGRPLSGPISHYHSAIAFACYRAGISAQDALAYFNGAFYERCGYLDVWAPERARLLAEFDACDLDIRSCLPKWGRTGAFMYSNNHPRIRPIYDMASMLLQAQGYTPQRSDLLPHDNLASSPAFAVYPEIGEALGVPGQYLFRAARNYQPISLAEYVTGCYALYATISPAEMVPFPEFRAQLDRIATLL